MNRKRNKVIYWIATLWLALGMLSTGLVQMLRIEEDVNVISSLGYPVYLLTILAFWKIFGVVALLVPRFPLLKEWAYAGFFFAMSGAIFSHIATRNPVTDILPSLLLLILTGISWYFRPESRKVVPVHAKK